MKIGINTALPVALAMLSLACGFHFSTARIIEAQLSKEVNDKQEVVNPTTSFDSNERVIHAVVRLAALLAIDSEACIYEWDVDEALAAGLTREEIVGCLIATASLIGIPRAVAAAPGIASMIGFDMDGALEGTAEAG